MKPSTVYLYMKLLENNNNITIKPNNKFSVVTIVNWELYQTEEENVSSKLTTKQQQINNKLTHTRMNKNVKNVKNINSRKYDENFLNNLINIGG